MPSFVDAFTVIIASLTWPVTTPSALTAAPVVEEV